MLFSNVRLKGAYLIELEKLADDRGFFARSWCQMEFGKYGMCTRVAQCNIGFSKKKGTLRGLHYQIAPYQEAKLVRCTKGAIYDVIIDLRPDSPTYKEWLGIELSAENHRMLYVPEGFAHGYQTLVHETEIFYQTSQFYNPEFARGVRYDDPAFGVEWPFAVASISDTDRSWPDYKAEN
jgi:dTDP-4-dehydrorhamnose 3,5-epimerase